MSSFTPKASAALMPVSGGGVLVAEDEPSEQFLLRRAIKSAGVESKVDFVSDGYAVLSFLQHPPGGILPSLLLLDIRMPGLDGFEVLEWLEHRPELRPAYVVILSSSMLGSDIARAKRLGVDHYLVKPQDPSELVATVKRLEPYWAEQRPMPVDAHAAAYVQKPVEAFSYVEAV